MVRTRILAPIFVAAFAYGCDEKKDDAEASEEDGATDGIQGGDQPDNDDGGTSEGDDGVVDGSTDDGNVGLESCGDLAHGEGATRVRYATAEVVNGLAVCDPEEQAITCNDGDLTATGSYTEESCDVVPAALGQGDIVVFNEDRDHMHAFSPTGVYKGLAFDATGIVPWYTYGLRLSFGYFTDKFHLEVGSSNADLAIAVRRFPTITSYPYVLSMPDSGPASDALYFQGAFSEEYNTVRRVAVSDGTVLESYVSGVGHVADCDVSMPVGSHARAIHSGTQSFVYPTHVAYTLGTGVDVTGYGVARLNGSCTAPGGTPSTVNVLFEDTTFDDAKVTSLLHVRTEDAGGAGSWKNDIFVTTGIFLAGQFVSHWHYDTGLTTWVEQASPFVGTARAIFQDGTGDIYTIESDGGGAASIRRYATMESGGTHLVATIVTEPDGAKLLNGSLGHWLAVMPELP
jgi:hypothetical protein